MAKKTLFILCIAFMGLKASAQQTWTPQEINGDSTYYYILNKATNLFITETGFSERAPMKFLCVSTKEENNDEKYVLENPNHSFINITIEANSGTFGGKTPKSVSFSIYGDTTPLTVSGSKEGYAFSVTESWKYGFLNRNSTSYTAYLTITQNEESAEDGTTTVTSALATTADAEDDNCLWILVSQEEYASSPYAREDAIARLTAAIESAQATSELDGPTWTKAKLGTNILSAQTTLRRATSSSSAISGRYSVDDINDAADKLNEVNLDAQTKIAHYNDCLEVIEETNQIGGTGIQLACSTAKASVKMATSPSAMDNAMSALRLAVLACLAVNENVNENSDLSVLINNQSFETGTLTGWSNLKINSDQITEVAGSVMQGDLSSLGSLVSIGEFSEYSSPVLNEGSNAMTNGHKKFYYNTNIPSTSILSSATGDIILQPMIGLPNGEYTMSAMMYHKSSLIDVNSNYLSTIIIPKSVYSEIIGDIDITKITDMSYIISLIGENLGTLIEQSTIEYGSGKSKTTNQFEEVTCDFKAEEGSIVIVVLNSGLFPLVSNGAFKADNVRLKYNQKIQVPGDVNVDGKVSIADISAAIQLMLYPETEGYKMKNGDFDNNGKITVSDIQTLKSLILE